MKVNNNIKEKTDLKSLSSQQLSEFISCLRLQSYRADQIFRWLYQKGARNFDEMTNLSKDLRLQLAETASISRILPQRQLNSDDGTVKFLFQLQDDEKYKIEAVLIPTFYDDGQANRLTVCVSSQVGCVFGCAFCATGKMGLYRSLSHGEIVDQVQYINDYCEYRYGKKITNIVYMGMGEPLHNYAAVTESAKIITDERSINLSPKRITVSTVGLTKQIKKLADEKHSFKLAVSLHAANDEKRNKIMPVNDAMGLDKLKEALQYYYQALNRPITYEYLLFDEFNDTPQDAAQLAEIVHWIPAKVNIIMYNNVAGVALNRAREERLEKFMRELKNRNVRATVRRSRGDDIEAGCGQLAVKEGLTDGKTIRKKQSV
jgi:23S rRNA (adenine2503-C2)-methyltransferase